MTFFERFDAECKKQDTTPTALLKSLNISTSKLTAWKKGAMPSSEWVILISEELGVSIEYLLTGKDTSSVPELRQYHSNHSETDEISKRYNTICKVMRLIHGKKKAFAILSAINLPNDKPVAFSKAQIAYLAYKTCVNEAFFNDESLVECDPEQLEKKRRAYAMELDYEDLQDLERAYPESEVWEKNYKHLYFEAMQMGLNMAVFEEITNTLSRFSNEEQVEIKVIFEEAVKRYEDKIKRRMAQEFDDISAERKGEVS